ncbi:hypothetical protein [Paenibacillus brevis]|nr:hypothetical protein [Paenibacillus brevis]
MDSLQSGVNSADQQEADKIGHPYASLTTVRSRVIQASVAAP